jgi:hypothetical protein
MLTGATEASELARLYRNGACVANVAPAAPSGLENHLTEGPSGSLVTLSWTAPSDAETPSTGLSYSLRIGTTPGGSEILAPMANVTNGFRQVAERGPVQALSWALSLPSSSQIYYWSVQAVDGALAGGPFAPEARFSRAWTSVDEQPAPNAFALRANAPNPFNPATTIAFSLPQETRVWLAIYDLSGRLVRVLVDEVRAAGSYEVPWNGANEAGKQMASGVYICRMEAGSFRETRRMTLVK